MSSSSTHNNGLLSDESVDLTDPLVKIPLSVNPLTLPDDVVRDRIDNLIDKIYCGTEHSSNETRHLLPAVEELCSDFGFTSRGVPSAEHMISDLEYVRNKLIGYW